MQSQSRFRIHVVDRVGYSQLRRAEGWEILGQSREVIIVDGRYIHGSILSVKLFAVGRIDMGVVLIQVVTEVVLEITKIRFQILVLKSGWIRFQNFRRGWNGEGSVNPGGTSCMRYDSDAT